MLPGPFIVTTRPIWALWSPWAAGVSWLGPALLFGSVNLLKLYKFPAGVSSRIQKTCFRLKGLTPFTKPRPFVCTSWSPDLPGGRVYLPGPWNLQHPVCCEGPSSLPMIPAPEPQNMGLRSLRILGARMPPGSTAPLLNGGCKELDCVPPKFICWKP